MLELTLPDLAATEALGRRLAAHLVPDAVVALVGPLGAGKTHLVRAVVAGLGAPDVRVSSPTFALVHEYPARLPVYHFDAYRLADPRDFLDLGAEEYFTSGGVCLIEWADRVAAALPPDRLTVTLTPVGDTQRLARLTADGPTHADLLRRLADDLRQDAGVGLGAGGGAA